MAPDEIAPGRHYVGGPGLSGEDYRYYQSRRVLAIQRGQVHYAETYRPPKIVALKTFAKWATRPLKPAEPANPYAMVLTFGRRAIWHVYRQGSKESFWYSLHHQEIYDERELTELTSRHHWFDVRDLPNSYRDGFDIEPYPSFSAATAGGLSPLECEMRRRNGHIAAIALALRDGVFEPDGPQLVGAYSRLPLPKYPQYPAGAPEGGAA